MKKISLLITAYALATSFSFGASTALNFSLQYDGGIVAGLANAAGVASNDLFWGVLVDSDMNGISFSDGITNKYDAITPALNLTTTLNKSTLATGDVMFFGSTLTLNTNVLEGFNSEIGGVGGIADTIVIELAGNVGTGDNFYLFWLSGTKGGILSAANWQLPAAGNLTDFDAPFLGVDPSRSASSSYVGTSGTPTGTGIAFVPEPSAALLGALGALGLLRRRRN